MEHTLRKETIIQELCRSTHGKLSEYVPVGLQAAKEEPEFLAHLIAWNRIKGQVRDSKTALPVVQLNRYSYINSRFKDNALAHLALLSPRDLLKAYNFAKEAGNKDKDCGDEHGMRAIRDMIQRYLRVREANPAWFERTALQHRRSLKSLYALTHTRPSPRADLIVMKDKKPEGSIFAKVAQLRNMAPDEAAGTILQAKIPFLAAQGAMGKKMKEPEIVLALISRMSPTELITNSAWLQKVGVKTNPALRAAYAEAMGKVDRTRGANVLKATRAAEVAEENEDEPLAAKLAEVQERQLEAAKKSGAGIDGNWLVLGDCSGSMEVAIEASRRISATLAKMVKGKVHLVFFNTTPRRIDVTGKTYEEILDITRPVEARGGTSIGCGLDAISDANINVDGIAIVSDGAENNHPQFAPIYANYCKKFDKRPPVYLYLLDGTDNPMHAQVFLRNMQSMQVPGNVFDLRGKQVDYYALPNLVQTMRVDKYSLVQEIMDTPLLKLEDVFQQKNERSPVYARV